MRFSFWMRWVALIVTGRPRCRVVGVGGVDLADDAQGSVVVAVEPLAFGGAGSAELAEEGFGAFGVLDPDGSVNQQ